MINYENKLKTTTEDILYGNVPWENIQKHSNPFIVNNYYLITLFDRISSCHSVKYTTRYYYGLRMHFIVIRNVLSLQPWQPGFNSLHFIQAC